MSDHDSAHAGHGVHINRKEYWIIFVWLTVLTVLEVVIAQIPIGKTVMIIGLIGLAIAKAALVGLFYMHLKHETPIMKWTVAIPMALPVLYAVVLIAEAAWRLL